MASPDRYSVGCDWRFDSIDLNDSFGRAYYETLKQKLSDYYIYNVETNFDDPLHPYIRICDDGDYEDSPPIYQFFDKCEHSEAQELKVVFDIYRSSWEEEVDFSITLNLPIPHR